MSFDFGFLANVTTSDELLYVLSHSGPKVIAGQLSRSIPLHWFLHPCDTWCHPVATGNSLHRPPQDQAGHSSRVAYPLGQPAVSNPLPRMLSQCLEFPSSFSISGTFQLMSNFVATTRTQVHPDGPPLGHSTPALSFRIQTQFRVCLE